MAKSNGKSFDIFGAITKGLSKGKNKLVSALGGMFTGIKSSLEQIVKGWVDWQDATFATARAIGLTREQAQGLQDVLMKDQAELSRMYGLTGKEINDFQRGIVSNTGRAIILTKEQTESLAVLRNLVNDGGSGGTENMLQLVGAFQEFGISINDSMVHVAMLQEKAAEYGMSAQAASAELAKNIRLAQSYTFKHGIDGLAAMVLKAKQLRVDIQSIVAASEKFTSIEDSIKNAAGIQMLGGTFAANFANPMSVMADALMNQEAFGDRIIGALEGKGTWNEKTGQVDISAVDRAMIKQFANTVGLKFEDAIKMAQSSAQNAAIDQRLSMNANQFSDAQQQWIRSNAQWSAEKHTFVVAGIDENGNRVESEVENLTPQMLDSMRSSALTEENMMANVAEINDNVRSLAGKAGMTRAQRLVSAQQNASGMANAFSTSAARMVAPIGNRVSNVINGNSKTAQNLDKVAGNPYYAAVATMGVDAVKSLYKGLTGSGGLSEAFGKTALAIGGVSIGAISAGKSLEDLSKMVKGVAKDFMDDMKGNGGSENYGAKTNTAGEKPRGGGNRAETPTTTPKPENAKGKTTREKGKKPESKAEQKPNEEPKQETATPVVTVPIAQVTPEDAAVTNSSGAQIDRTRTNTAAARPTVTVSVESTEPEATAIANSSAQRPDIQSASQAEGSVAQARTLANVSPGSEEREPIGQTAIDVLNNNNAQTQNVAYYSVETPSVVAKPDTGGTTVVTETSTTNSVTYANLSGGGYPNAGPVGSKDIHVTVTFEGTSTLDLAGISKTDVRDLMKNGNENVLMDMIRGVVSNEIAEYAYKSGNFNALTGMYDGGSVT